MRTLKNSIAIAALCITALVLNAGAQAPAKPVNTEKVFVSVEKMPVFPGGVDAFVKFVATSIRYPYTDWKNNIQGQVYLKFIVEADGSVTNVEAVRAPSETLKDEALRVMATSPKWTPGEQNGKNVRVEHTLPVNFTLSTS